MKKKQLQNILRGLAEEATPTHFDLWDQIRNRARPAKRRQNVLVGLVTLSLGLLITLVLIFSVKSRSATIAVLASPTATQAAATAAPTTMPTAITSYRGVIVGQVREAATLDNPVSYQLWQAYIWYQAPNFLRIEEYPTCLKTPVEAPGQSPALPPLEQGLRANFTGPTFARCTEPNWITIRLDSWIIHVINEGNGMTATYGDLMNAYVLGAALPVDLEAFLPSAEKSMVSMGQPAGMGGATFGAITTDTIIGRPAQKFDERFEFFLQGKPSVKQNIHRSLWIDQQVTIPIAAETIDDQGFIWDSWSFTQLEVNPPTDPSLFAYLPRTSDSVALDGLTTIWGLMAHNATFSVFAPGDNTIASIKTATKLMPQYPVNDTARHILTQTYLSRADPTKYVVVLTITEQPAAGTPEPTYQYHESDGKRTLTFDRGGTHITLEGSNEVTKQDLYDIANNMQPLS